MIAGKSKNYTDDHLTNDPVFTQVMETEALASHTSLSRLIQRFDNESLEQLNLANQELLDKIHQYRDAKSIILDLDSTHADTYGDQEDTAFNAHYGTIGFHPLVCFNGMTGDFIKAIFRLY